MSKIPVLIDTDGQADSLWGLVISAKRLDVKAITVCTGKNKHLEESLNNTRGFAAMAGIGAAVSPGSERTVLKKDKPVWTRFLPDGKCGLPLPKEAAPLDSRPAWDCIYEEAKAMEGELTVMCFGPMTNLALAIFKYPDLPQLIKKVVFVGGSYDYGDYSSVVEINMATDPEAARAVFQSGIPMEMYGCNVEMKSALSNGEIGRIVDGAKGPYTTAFVMCGMSHKPGMPVYYGPAVAAMGVAEPEKVVRERYNVFLETKGNLCRGRTIPLNMYTPLGFSKDTLVAMDLDKEYYVEMLRELLAEYEALP